MMAVSLMSRDNSLINDSNGRRNKNMTVENIIYICTIYTLSALDMKYLYGYRFKGRVKKSMEISIRGGV